MSKISLKIHPTFWLLAGLIGFSSSQHLLDIAIWVAIVFVSVLLHELGHALTALYFHQTACIELTLTGGVTYRQGEPLPGIKEFFVVLNGPLAGFAFALIASVVHFSSPLMVLMTHWTIQANLLWTIFNLLPIYPLDGGQLLLLVMRGAFGLKGEKIALLFGGLFALLLGIYLFAYGILVAGAICFMLAFESYQSWQSVADRTEIDRELQRKLKDAYRDPAHSVELLEEIREKGSSAISLSATELLAEIAMQRGEEKRAYHLLSTVENRVTDRSLPLLHLLCYKRENYSQVIALAEQAYQLQPNFETALINAYAHAKRQNAEPATGWFMRSVADGLTDPLLVAKESAFDDIRNLPAFASFVKSLR